MLAAEAAGILPEERERQDRDTVSAALRVCPALPRIESLWQDGGGRLETTMLAAPTLAAKTRSSAANPLPRSSLAHGRHPEPEPLVSRL
jgi:hypothetical protein